MASAGPRLCRCLQQLWQVEALLPTTSKDRYCLMRSSNDAAPRHESVDGGLGEDITGAFLAVVEVAAETANSLYERPATRAWPCSSRKAR